MSRFSFSVSRTSWSNDRIYEVEAKTPEEAENKCFQEACNDEWSDSSSDYEIQLIEKSKPTCGDRNLCASDLHGQEPFYSKATTILTEGFEGYLDKNSQFYQDSREVIEAVHGGILDAHNSTGDVGPELDQALEQAYDRLIFLIAVQIGLNTGVDPIRVPSN